MDLKTEEIKIFKKPTPPVKSKTKLKSYVPKETYSAHLGQKVPIFEENVQKPISPKEERQNAGETERSRTKPNLPRQIFLILSLACIIGLASGIGIGLLLANGDLDLSLKDVKTIFRTVRAIF